MTVTAHRRVSAGELIAYALPPGEVWLEILAAHASSGASFFPIDVRLSDREQRASVERARPRLLVTPDDEVLFADPAPVDPDRAWAVVATSGVSGKPKLAELPRTALGAAVAGSLTALDASSFDAWVACLSPAHVGGLLVLLRGALAGAPVDVLDGSDPSAAIVVALRRGLASRVRHRPGRNGPRVSSATPIRGCGRWVCRGAPRPAEGSTGTPPRRPRAAPEAGSSRIERHASAHCSAESTSQPVTPSSICVTIPPTRPATIGRPFQSASVTVSPKPSRMLFWIRLALCLATRLLLTPVPGSVTRPPSARLYHSESARRRRAVVVR